jgi:hypothetical protein
MPDVGVRDEVCGSPMVVGFFFSMVVSFALGMVMIMSFAFSMVVSFALGMVMVVAFAHQGVGYGGFKYGDFRGGVAAGFNQT